MGLVPKMPIIGKGNGMLIDKIEMLLDGIRDTEAVFRDNPNGPYEMHCPCCEAYEIYSYKDPTPTMQTINHYDYCFYVQAGIILDEIDGDDKLQLVRKIKEKREK